MLTTSVAIDMISVIFVSVVEFCGLTQKYMTKLKRLVRDKQSKSKNSAYKIPMQENNCLKLTHMSN
jgi:hypothetical protein